MPVNWTKNDPVKEKAWERAVEIFKKQYKRSPKGDDYAIVMTIAKSIVKGKKSKNEGFEKLKDILWEIQ